MLRFHFTDFRHCDRFAVREKARSAWVLDASIFVLDRSFAECDLRDEAAMFAGRGHPCGSRPPMLSVASLTFRW
jgi:hypothetical protein